jgi:hypothetical protein
LESVFDANFSVDRRIGVRPQAERPVIAGYCKQHGLLKSPRTSRVSYFSLADYLSNHRLFKWASASITLSEE